jgi:hypothetical protein
LSQQQLRRFGGLAASVLVLGLLAFAAWHAASAPDTQAGPPDGRGGGPREAAGPPAPPAADKSAAPKAGGKTGPWGKGPEAYDPAKVAADPDYFKKADPTRVFQRADPPAGAKRHPELRLLSEPAVVTAAQNKLEKPIRVKARPGRPVTFFAPDSGLFANGEQAVTVKADKDGLAEAEFWVTNEGYYRVLVGSPESHGPLTVSVTALRAAELARLRAVPAGKAPGR